MKRRTLPIVEFQQGVPIPPRYPRHFGIWAPILQAMKPGQSFVIQNEKDRCAILQQAKRFKMKITTRKLEKGGWGVWKPNGS